MTPLPRGFGIALDRSVRIHRGGRLLEGGTPPRLIRLTATGAAALQVLLDGGAANYAARMLARRLVDGGLAHPRPPHDRGAGVTVVVPVRDRPALLDRCLTALGGAAPVVVVDDGSRDARRTRAVCSSHGASLVRLYAPRGPAAARNTARPLVQTEFIAFVDSDCIVAQDWLAELTPHFGDPLVGAVAPRIVPRDRGRPDVLSRFAAARSPLDLGAEEGAVGFRRRIPYVPTAALVVRGSALRGGFDEALSQGEDVDAVWRLQSDGWQIRYVPQVVVEHDEPAAWSCTLLRRFRYGTSAAPLAMRHPGKLAHAVPSPWPALTAALVLSQRRRAALAAVTWQAVVLAWRTQGVGVPAIRLPQWVVRGVVQSVVDTGRTTTMLAAPALAGACVSRRTRATALLLLVCAPIAEWLHRRPRLDPLLWTAACIVDDVAYGAGVWRGCIAQRTLAPITPRLGPKSAAWTPPPAPGPDSG